MVKVEGQRLIRVPVQKVYQLVSRVESIPRYTEVWLTADVLEQKKGSSLVHLRGYFAGMPVDSVHRIVLQAPARVEFRQVRGTMKVFRGEYRLREVDGGTELVLRVEADAGIPVLPEESVRRALYLFVERTLDRMKLLAERDLRVPRRVKEKAAAEEAEQPVEVSPPTETPPAPPLEERKPEEVKKRKRRRRRRKRTHEGR
ncbi:MAG: SRPBCC family protein [Armatimonadota bacterium]|nr:SRPBCC family protein [Armatimonadota bacterium]MDR5703139.1 SRPBCC family protein [Armatimonadota bacterium]MDR7433991.1 SRPBCC family protein [Armatimonadota bacterium]